MAVAMHGGGYLPLSQPLFSVLRIEPKTLSIYPRALPRSCMPSFILCFLFAGKQRGGGI